jgi:DNA-binding transcriptional ArsR family regulator
LEQPELTVEAVAERTGLPEDQASLCLRALQSRGLIQARRHSRWVHYRPEPDRYVPVAAPLLCALRHALLDDRLPERDILQALTAFTHPRRLTILRRLQLAAPVPAAALSLDTQISPPALQRHLRKLRTRALVHLSEEGWRLVPFPPPFPQAILTIVALGSCPALQIGYSIRRA